MRRSNRFFIYLLLFGFGIFELHEITDRDIKNSGEYSVLLANAPADEEPPPPPPPIGNSPIPPDTIIYGPDGMPIFLIEE